MKDVVESARTVGVAAALIGGFLGGAGCSADRDNPPPSASCSMEVQRFKELMIVDEAVMTDPRVRNTEGGVWSFRYLIEQMKPASMSSSDFVADWLQSWTREQRVNLFLVPKRPRVDAVLICPWLRRTPSNNCNADCSRCDAREFDLAQAPFRLIGIVNRLDLHETERRSGVGEGRLAYAVTNGAGDDPAAPPLRMTTIFEYDLPSSNGRNIRYWAERWHSLGKHSDFSAAFLDEVADVTQEFTARDVTPGAPNGSALNQVRTNEIDLDWLWDLREFHLTDAGLRLGSTHNTPDKSLNNSRELTEFANANRSDILLNRHATPSMITGGAAIPDTRWHLPGASEDVRHAFARNTCDGCHQTEETPIDINFHLSPFRKGIEKLSPFLNSPERTSDELAVRAASMRNVLCAQ